MRDINTIVIHCADTPPDMDIGLKEITEWHTAEPPKGNGWSKVGYHYIIRRDGTVERGVPEEEPGIHVGNVGRNHDTLGICLVGGKGGCNYTLDQWLSLDKVLDFLVAAYPNAQIVGHRDLDPSKQCPQFDAEYLL